ncbi:MAG: hypothetical protein ACI4MV_02460 [Christensenellales bacterium]
MALATIDAILADAIDTITIAVAIAAGLTTVDEAARETTDEIVVHPIVIGVHRQDTVAKVVAATF